MTLVRQPYSETDSPFAGTRVLVVDDEEGIRHTLTDLFARMGCQASSAATGEAALEQITQQQFDLVILDLNMPGIDGTAVLRAARPRATDTVFIILTGYGTLDSAILAIRHGAFDYLIKPSSIPKIIQAAEAGLTERQKRRQPQEEPVELLERALASLRAEAPQPSESAPTRFVQAAGVTLDTLRQLAVVRGQPVRLTKTEFDILSYLMRRQGQIVSCRQLVAHVRGYELDERDARLLLRSHIHRLRRKLEDDPSNPQIICTVRGSGYVIHPQPLTP